MILMRRNNKVAVSLGPAVDKAINGGAWFLLHVLIGKEREGERERESEREREEEEEEEEEGEEEEEEEEEEVGSESRSRKIRAVCIRLRFEYKSVPKPVATPDGDLGVHGNSVSKEVFSYLNERRLVDYVFSHGFGF